MSTHATERSWWPGSEESRNRAAEDARSSSPSHCATRRQTLCWIWPQERWLSCRILNNTPSLPSQFLWIFSHWWLNQEPGNMNIHIVRQCTSHSKPSAWNPMHKVAQRLPVFINISFSFWWKNVLLVPTVPNFHIERSMIFPSLFIPFVCRERGLIISMWGSFGTWFHCMGSLLCNGVLWVNGHVKSDSKWAIQKVPVKVTKSGK